MSPEEAATAYVVEISNVEWESYFNVPSAILLEVVKLTPSKAGELIRSKCEKAQISSSDDVELAFSENMEEYDGWEEEWKDFKAEITD